MNQIRGTVRAGGDGPHLSGSFVSPDTDREEGTVEILGGSISTTLGDGADIQTGDTFDVVITKREPTGDASSDDDGEKVDGNAADESEQPETD